MSYILLPLSRGLFTTVDLDCPPEILDHKWSITPNGREFYVCRGTTGKDRERLNRIVIGAAPDKVVDHRNGDSLDNRRKNLRECSQADNTKNRKKWSKKTSSRFKGVTWNKQRGRWQPQIMLNGQRKYLGCFDDEVAAAKAYDKAAVELFGEFARTNF